MNSLRLISPPFESARSVGNGDMPSSPSDRELVGEGDGLLSTVRNSRDKVSNTQVYTREANVPSNASEPFISSGGHGSSGRGSTSSSPRVRHSAKGIGRDVSRGDVVSDSNMQRKHSAPHSNRTLRVA